MTDMMAEIAAFDGRTAKIVGPARSGKTEALLRRAGPQETGEKEYTLGKLYVSPSRHLVRVDGKEVSPTM